MKKHLPVIITGVIILIVITGCLAGPNTAQEVPSPENTLVAGFWRGLWHGIIAPFSFFVSLFIEGISMYEVHNNGGWYDAGFALGATVIFGGGGRGSKMKRKKKSVIGDQ